MRAVHGYAVHLGRGKILSDLKACPGPTKHTASRHKTTRRIAFAGSTQAHPAQSSRQSR